MNPEETIEINNFKAQYNSIAQRVQEANIELENKLTLRNEAEAEYKHLCDKISMALTTFDEVLEGAEKTKFALSERTAAIVKGESDLKAEQEAFETYQRVAKEQADKEIADKKFELSQFEMFIQEANSTKSHLKEEIDAYKLMGADMFADIKNLQLAKDDIENEIAKAKEVHNTMSPLLDKQIAEKKEELKVLEETITEEKEKIAMPLLFLRAKQDVIEKRERDLNILIARFKPQWEMLNPGLEMNV